jgi:hypothetical protein
VLFVFSGLIALVPTAMVIVGLDVRQRRRGTPAGRTVAIAAGVAIVTVMAWAVVRGDRMHNPKSRRPS